MQTPLGQAPLDVRLARKQPVHGGVQIVLAHLSQTQRLTQGVAGRFFSQPPGRGQLGARMQDAGRDQRYGPVALWRRLRVDQAGKAQPLEGAERRGGVAVRQGALNLEGFRQPLNGGSALEQHAQAFDHFGGGISTGWPGCVS